VTRGTAYFLGGLGDLVGFGVCPLPLPLPFPLPGGGLALVGLGLGRGLDGLDVGLDVGLGLGLGAGLELVPVGLGLGPGWPDRDGRGLDGPGLGEVRGRAAAGCARLLTRNVVRYDRTRGAVTST